MSNDNDEVVEGTVVKRTVTGRIVTPLPTIREVDHHPTQVDEAVCQKLIETCDFSAIEEMIYNSCAGQFIGLSHQLKNEDEE